MALAAAGKLDEAIAAWSRALLSNPQHAKARRNIELARARLAAIGARAPARDRDATISDATQLIARGRHASALAILDDLAARTDSTEAALSDLRARALLGAGAPRRAEVVYLTLLAREPAALEPWRGLGDVYRFAGEPDRARHMYRQYLLRAPGDDPRRAAIERLVDPR